MLYVALLFRSRTLSRNIRFVWLKQLAYRLSRPQKFNPDLQRRNLELKDRRQHDFDDFVKQLKEHSKSDKTSQLYPF